jgi:predicted dehydrogenase
MLGIGIIGCGKIAQVRHLPEYHASPDCRIVALTDLNRARAADLARQYEAEAVDDAEALLGRPDIDAVSVCVANSDHAAMAISALRAGKHVLCEKPMATQLGDCRRMVQIAGETGRLLLVGHNQRLLKTHQIARDLIRRGEIGAILTFSTTFGHSGPENWSIDAGGKLWFFDKQLAVHGALFDLGVHKIDLIRFLLDDPIESVFTQTATRDKRDLAGDLIAVEDNAICQLRLRSGAIGTVSASWTYYGGERNCTQVFGALGTLKIYDHPDFSCIIERKSGEKVYYQADAIQTNAHQANSGVIDDFVAAIRSGRPSVNTGHEALASMQAVFACIRSAAQGMPVLVDTID